MKSFIEKSNFPKGKYRPGLVSLCLLISDIFAIVLAFFLSFSIRKVLIPILGGVLSIDMVLPIFWISIILILGTFAAKNFYPGHGRTGVVEYIEVVKNVALIFITIGLIIYIFGVTQQVSRTVLIFFWFISTTLLLAFRLVIQNRGSLKDWWNQPVVIIGQEGEIYQIISQLNHARRLGYKPVISLVDEAGFSPGVINGIPAFEYSMERHKEVKDKGIKLVIIADQNQVSRRKAKALVHNLSLDFPHIVYSMGDSPLGLFAMDSIDIDGYPALSIKYKLFDPFSRFVKRLVDLTISLLTLVFSLLTIIFIGLLIKIDSPGPVFFIQKRMGRNGRIFNLYKFRTMYTDAEEKLGVLLKSDQELRQEFRKYHKLKQDPRITNIGKILRKTSLDEFPQIWNIIKGDMSIVGPRAFLPSELKEMGGSANIIHRVSPGLTGWWQVMGRHDVSFKERLRLDEYYISNFSLWIDMYIIMKTVWVVLSGHGV